MENTGTTSISLQFPILVIQKNGQGSLSLSERTLTKWSHSVAQNQDYYKHLIFIDQTGSQYRISRLDIIGNVNRFWGLDLFLDMSVFVHLDLQHVEYHNMEKLKQVAFSVASKNHDNYDSIGISIENVIINIKKAPTPSGVIKALALG